MRTPLLVVGAVMGAGTAAADGPFRLYVAESQANQVLVYRLAHADQPIATIRAGVTSPAALCTDRAGNLYCGQRQQYRDALPA